MAGTTVLLPLIIVMLVLFSLTDSVAADSANQAYETVEVFKDQKTRNMDLFNKEKIGAVQSYQNLMDTMSKGNSSIDAAHETVRLEREHSSSTKRQQMFENGTIVGGISNKVFAENEALRRQQLNLEKEDQLYVFVSRSMPESLLRSYALDAAYTSAVLVMRGVKKDETLDTFFRGQLMQDLKPDGAGAMVQLDPRLFDAFEVDAVPAIVFTKNSLIDLCATPNSTNVQCEPISSEKYYKITGSVSLKYALDQFIQEGADAQRFLSNLKKHEVVDDENSKLALGVANEAYRSALAEISYNTPMPDNDFEYQQDTHLLEIENYSTPFGTIKAPKGTRQLLKRLSN